MVDLVQPRPLRPRERAAEDHAKLRATRRRAVLVVCRNALDATDAAELLEALGLDPREGSADDVDVPRPVYGALPSYNEVSVRRS